MSVLEQNQNDKAIRPQTIALVALDATRAFADEVELTGIVSPELIDLARRHIATEPDLLSLASVASFTDSLSRERGGCRAAQLAEWQSVAYPCKSTESQLWLWSILLETLRQAWDASGQSFISLPLANSRSRYRVAIRDYLDHNRNVRAEIELVVENCPSEWDRKFQERNSEWFDVRTRLYHFVQQFAARKLWLAILPELSDDERCALSQWARDEAVARQMPVELVSLPTSLAIERHGTAR